MRGPLRPGRIPRFVWRAGASPRPASCSFVSPQPGGLGIAVPNEAASPPGPHRARVPPAPRPGGRRLDIVFASSVHPLGVASAAREEKQTCLGQAGGTGGVGRGNRKRLFSVHYKRGVLFGVRTAIEPLPNVVELWQAEEGELLLPTQVRRTR